MADDWDGAVKAAKKILGDDADIPKLSPKIPKSKDAKNKQAAEFGRSRADLKDKLLALQDSCQAFKDAVAQFQDEIEESDLGLKPKEKDNAKKIQDARKVLSAPLQEMIDTQGDNVKNLRELDRHLQNIMNYKQNA